MGAREEKGGVTYGLLKGCTHLMARVPLRAGRFLGKMLGLLAYLIPMGRKGVVRENIGNTIGKGLEAREIKRLTRGVYKHYGQMFFEVPHIVRLSRRNLGQYVVFQNEHILERALNQGRGVFVLTAHFGNWELMSAAVSLQYGRASVVARPLDFKPADRVVNELRSRFGTEVIDKQRAARKILEALKEGKMVGILLDQNVDWYEGVFVDFLGRLACTNKGLAAIALKTGSPIVPCFSIRQGDGRYRVIFGPEMVLEKTGDRTRDIEEGTAAFTKVIEKYVRLYPDHWFWFHKRWKTLPYCAIPERITPLFQTPGKKDHA